MSLSIIHFSDIHISGPKDIILDRIEQLKIACASALPCNGNVVIAISGDIGYSGKEAEYSLAMSLLSPIIEYINQERHSIVNVVCVPGNHDCDLSGNDSVRSCLIDSITPEKMDEDIYKVLISPQSNYNIFASYFGINTNTPLPMVELAIHENKVLFLLANTALLSVRNENPGKIIMPVNQYPEISPEKYKVVFLLAHHPINWLNPDYKTEYTDFIRNNADIVLFGHEHAKDNYEKYSSTFNIKCEHGKELQDSNSQNSAFSVLTFDETFQNYTTTDFVWSNDKYVRTSDPASNQYHKNIAALQTPFHPNEQALASNDDLGIAINHFAKDTVTLSDLFVWPYVYKCNHLNANSSAILINSDIEKELSQNKLTIITGGYCLGKSAIAKALFMADSSKQTCCIMLHGSNITSSDTNRIRGIIEEAFCKQYSNALLEEFRQLPKGQLSVIVDDFDQIKHVKDRRSVVLDYLCDNFGKVTITLSSSIEITSILTSRNITLKEDLYYYDILPFGNKKRKELIEKWYSLGNDKLTEDELSARVDEAQGLINRLLGFGSSFLPASPFFILTSLQNRDAINPTYEMSKYGFLYESLIVNNLSRISTDYTSSGNYSIDISVMSQVAYYMLTKEKSFTFNKNIVEGIVNTINKEKLLSIQYANVIIRMETAKIISKEPGQEDIYRFKYPYIFYYFAGRYIAEHINDKEVKDALEYMSSKLYNEIYGNIIIFVCHFANSQEVIDNIMINAYSTLDDYEPFDFTKTNSIFSEIREAVNALIPSSIVANSEVEKNKNNRLALFDDAGINDGQIRNDSDTINDTISEKEKDLASVTAALKTIEVLGQILQNYPVKISGNDKVEMISEIHRLGMRAVQAIIKTMGYLETELIEYAYQQAQLQKKNIRKDLIASTARRFINMLISTTARSMVHQIAESLDSNHLLLASQNTLQADDSISAKLVLVDLELNCLKKVNYPEIQKLRKQFLDKNEVFASQILDSIVAHYLNYNRCDYTLRSKLCELCHFSSNNSLVTSQMNLDR